MASTSAMRSDGLTDDWLDVGELSDFYSEILFMELSDSDYCDSDNDNDDNNDGNGGDDDDDGDIGYEDTSGEEDDNDDEGDGKMEALQRVETRINDSILSDNPPSGDTLFDGNLLPPEHYREQMQGLDPKTFTQKLYSTNTLTGMNNAESAWIRFCAAIIPTDDWKGHYLRLNITTLYIFFNWCFNQIFGKNGRQKRRMSKKKLLITFWCMFRLAFERQHGFKINEVLDCDQVSNMLADLNTRHALDHNTRENRSMTLQDLKD
ncbi:hypothetical protein F5Y09DRAFT_342422 [Xylaria sp. FL1042]|nr:hypothetical protein F5Y09DRAFT_342422 [Xylaria sp. FL1042]